MAKNSKKYKALSRYLDYIELVPDTNGQDIPQVFELTYSIPDASGDRIVNVSRAYEYRLDLISYEFYGTPKLWWIIALANNQDNVLAWPKAGDVIKVPADATVNRYL